MLSIKENLNFICFVQLSGVIGIGIVEIIDHSPIDWSAALETMAVLLCVSMVSGFISTPALLWWMDL